MKTRVTFAIGDPQAPFSTFRAILDRHGLLFGDRLRDDVKLISMGDHFDWGKPHERDHAAKDAMQLVRWLASHDEEHVVMLAGNHDLARVGELWGISDDEFQRAQTIADRAYLAKDAGADAEFRQAFPQFTTAEVVSRDLSTFRSEQRDVVTELLQARRLRMAHVDAGLLFVHAGVTSTELAVLDAPAPAGDDLEAIARALNAKLDEASASARRPLAIDGLHLPGDANAEGLGMLYHRPSRGHTDEERRELARPAPRRRFDPLTIPRGVTQVIGHIRDNKCRKLMPDLCDDKPARDGVLRSLVVDDAGARYRHGLQRMQVASGAAAGAMWFTDGGMSSCPVADYEILEVRARAAAVAP